MELHQIEFEVAVDVYVPPSWRMCLKHVTQWINLP
jgi:hypothetical protein